MTELRHSQTCEALQFVITLNNGEQVRLFVDTDKVSTALHFPELIKGITSSVMYSYEDIEVR